MFKKKEKRTMTPEQEFEILKLVLDKFLWVGTLLMLYALYLIFSTSESIYNSLSIMATGAIILLLFIGILIREYETSANKPQKKRN